MRTAKTALLSMLLLASGRAPGQEAHSPVSIKNPKAFAQLLADLGYKPGDLRTSAGFPQFSVDIADQPTNITFGGCSLAENCSYLVMSSSFSDVKNPPPKWITRMNDRFDLIKIGLNNDNNLYFSATQVIEGVPRSTLRLILEFWGRDAAALASEALKAKLNKGN